MKAMQVIEEILSKVFKWHRFPVSLKAEAVILYFKGLSLRAVREFLLHKGYKVSIEALREWFHAVGRALQAIYTVAIWVYVDETKIKARDRTYYLWLAVDERGLPVFVHLSIWEEECGREVVFLHQAQNKEVLQEVSLEC
jgi:transposase-like protein